MKLAAFYSEVTGLPVKEGSNEHWAGIRFGDIELAFIQVEDYRAPQWPDSDYPQQFHLDFEVDDIEAEELLCPGPRRDLSAGLHRPQRVRLSRLHRPHRPPLLPLPQQGRRLDRSGPRLARARPVSRGHAPL
ncbi:hypothetical protein SMICM304S_04133 [Streptomyces microflavus]